MQNDDINIDKYALLSTNHLGMHVENSFFFLRSNDGIHKINLPSIPAGKVAMAMYHTNGITYRYIDVHILKIIDR